jgi:hypothetical protein
MRTEFLLLDNGEISAVSPVTTGPGWPSAGPQHRHLRDNHRGHNPTGHRLCNFKEPGTCGSSCAGSVVAPRLSPRLGEMWLQRNARK